jgi:hypothetical protein
MGKAIIFAAVSPDGFIAAADNGTVGPLFDWYGNGDVDVTERSPPRSSWAARGPACWCSRRPPPAGTRLRRRGATARRPDLRSAGQPQ